MLPALVDDSQIAVFLSDPFGDDDAEAPTTGDHVEAVEGIRQRVVHDEHQPGPELPAPSNKALDPATAPEAAKPPPHRDTTSGSRAARQTKWEGLSVGLKSSDGPFGPRRGRRRLRDGRRGRSG